jgi:hypothetical protein
VHRIDAKKDWDPFGPARQQFVQNVCSIIGFSLRER